MYFQPKQEHHGEKRLQDALKKYIYSAKEKYTERWYFHNKYCNKGNERSLCKLITNQLRCRVVKILFS